MTWIHNELDVMVMSPQCHSIWWYQRVKLRNKSMRLRGVRAGGGREKLCATIIKRVRFVHSDVAGRVRHQPKSWKTNMNPKCWCKPVNMVINWPVLYSISFLIFFIRYNEPCFHDISMTTFTDSAISNHGPLWLIERKKFALFEETLTTGATYYPCI